MNESKIWERERIIVNFPSVKNKTCYVFLKSILMGIKSLWYLNSIGYI